MKNKWIKQNDDLKVSEHMFYEKWWNYYYGTERMLELIKKQKLEDLKLQIIAQNPCACFGVEIKDKENNEK